MRRAAKLRGCARRSPSPPASSAAREAAARKLARRPLTGDRIVCSSRGRARASTAPSPTLGGGKPRAGRQCPSTRKRCTAAERGGWGHRHARLRARWRRLVGHGRRARVRQRGRRGAAAVHQTSAALRQSLIEMPPPAARWPRTTRRSQKAARRPSAAGGGIDTQRGFAERPLGLVGSSHAPSTQRPVRRSRFLANV